MALAIELAAARIPSLGLDGLEAGLADRLRLLTGGRRSMTAIARCGRRSTGATRCSRRGNRPSCGGSRSSPALHRPRCCGAGRLVAGSARRGPGDPGQARRAEPAGRERGSRRNPLPCPGDDPPVRQRTARRRRRIGRRPLETRALVPGHCDRIRVGSRSRHRYVALGVRPACRRAAQCAGLGDRTGRIPVRGAPAGDQAGRVVLRPRHVRRVAAALRAGRRACRGRGRRGCRAAQCRRRRGVATLRRRRAAVAPGRGGGGAAGR